MHPLDSWTIPTLLDQAVSRTPEKIAVADIESGHEYTYSELSEAVASVSNGLTACGVERGDRVALCLKNRPETVLLLLAIQQIGAIAVPFNFRSPASGIQRTLEDSTPRVFAFGPTVRNEVVSRRSKLDFETAVYVGSDPPEFVTPFESLRDSMSERGGQFSVKPTDIGVIMYSSGTTGAPKGVKITQAAATAWPLVNSLTQGYDVDNECMIGVMPLYHSVGLHCILGTMIALSGTYVPFREFDPGRVLKAIEEWEVTALHEAPTVFKRLVESDELSATSLDSVERITYSGSPMESTLFDRVVDHFDPSFVSNQYGCTETFGPFHSVNLLDGGGPATTGGANVMQRTRIVELGSENPEAVVEPTVHGELIVSTDSPTMFSGYWNEPEKTEAAIIDGWFFTGDVAYRTENGRTIITGRADDMIISGGESVYPTTIEEVLMDHPAVASAAVVGVPDETWGEVPKAYVRVTKGVTSDELDRWCLESDSLADFKRPRAYEFVSEIPRNRTGKVKRYELRANHG